MSMVHPMARTTPRTRAEIHESKAPLTQVSQTYNISVATARKWRNRSDPLDRSHRAHQMNTTLNPAQELIVMEIRRLCLLPLDDLVCVTREFINAAASRSGSRSYRLACGDTSVLSVNLAGTSADQYTDRARDYAMNELDTIRYGFQGLAEEMLHQLGLAWWAQKYVAQDNMAALTGVVQYVLPSHALLLAPVTTRYLFGVPRSASFKTRAMDAKLDHVMVEHKVSDPAKRKDFVRMAGKFGSYMEGAVFDQAFNPFSPGGVSTISMMGQAHAQGMKVYMLKPGDEALVAQLNISPDVQSEINNALAYGREVTVPAQDISWDGYTGLGYIIEDPNDGSAAYQIDGGRSGAEAKASENVIPIPAMPDNLLIGLLLGSQLRTASAMLAVDAEGMIVGLVLPVVAVEGAAITALLGVLTMLMMLAWNLSKWVDQTYPRNTTTSGARWRKYTRFQDFIVARRLLYASNSGTFGGGGVYVADAYAEEQRGVNCATMSPLDIATRFQIPNPNRPDPSDITGFVDIVELRKGYLKVKQVGPNTAGQIEYLITKPIVVVPEFRDIPPTSSVTALVLTPGIVEIDNVCVIRGE